MGGGEKKRGMSRMSINRGKKINRRRNISCVKGERNISWHRNRTRKLVTLRSVYESKINSRLPLFPFSVADSDAMQVAVAAACSLTRISPGG